MKNGASLPFTCAKVKRASFNSNLRTLLQSRIKALGLYPLINFYADLTFKGISMTTAGTPWAHLMPAQFSEGLGNWSKQDGTAGSLTYADDDTAEFVPADQDFGGCLEFTKTAATQKIRYMGKTPMVPGVYLRVTARIKVQAGNFPAIRIAGWAGAGDDTHVSGLTEVGPSVAVTGYGRITEVSAIIGSDPRDGVDIVWGTRPEYGYFGLDVTGANGGVIRIDDLIIEDVSHLFARDMDASVNVVDFGAIRDGQTDDYDAFVAADRAANGRRLIVPVGTYFIGQSLALKSRTEFQGTLQMAASSVLVLSKSYDLPTYIDAFGDEMLGFKKAFQALLNNGDHDSLDLKGRAISVSEPIDMQAAVATKSEFATRRVIRNGQFYATGDTAWQPTVVTSQAQYSPNNARKLTNVSNIANIEVGSLVTGVGVGREVYVTSKDKDKKEIDLSEELFDADGVQNFTFTRFKYLMDFSGFSTLSKFSIESVELQCNSKASGIMLARGGITFHLKDSFITRPKHRGISSIGLGCQGMLIDRCHFVTAEGNVAAQDRISIVLNANGNDVKLRENWASQFRHFAILSGSNNIVSNNHFYQSDGVEDGARLAGIAMTRANSNSTIVGNYIDNSFVEWTNEHDASPDFTSGFGFSSLSITNNVFLSGDVTPWFSYIVIKPHGRNHGITGLTVTGNMFKSINGAIDRVDRVDTSYAEIDKDRLSNINFSGNAFNNITYKTANPLRVEVNQNTTTDTWVVSTNETLPFGGYAREVDSIMSQGGVRNASNVRIYDLPYAQVQKGSRKDEVWLTWGGAYKGNMAVNIRTDR